MVNSIIKSAYGIGKQARQSPANKEKYMKVKDFLLISCPAPIYFYNTNGEQMFAKNILEEFGEKEILEISINILENAFEIILK
jgi:hypothetical protein